MNPVISVESVKISGKQSGNSGTKSGSAAQIRVPGEIPVRGGPGVREDREVRGKVRHPEQGHPVLARAEEVAGAPEGQVRLGDAEAVVGAAELPQALQRLRVLLAREEDAVGFVPAPTDAAPELVELGEALGAASTS